MDTVMYEEFAYNMFWQENYFIIVIVPFRGPLGIRLGKVSAEENST